MDDYKKTLQWQALNKIWKNCSNECQGECKSEFEILATFIRENCTKTKIEHEKHEFYLNKFSDDAQKLIKNNTPNVYHSIMSVLDNGNFDSFDTFTEYYKNKYSSKRPEVFEDEKIIFEIMKKCWDVFNMRRR